MEKLYYISQGETPLNHLENIEKVCQAGCRLVQLRLKSVSDGIYLETAKKAKKICRTYSATLVINDNVNIAFASDADGIHIGKTDMPPSQAKAIIGSGIIGGTANTLDDCLRLIEQKVDYIGLGPFRYTTTKDKLSPILGLDGYKEIIQKLKVLKKDIPIVAIGGIQSSDFDALFAIGVSGIAVSGLLTDKPESELKNILKLADQSKATALKSKSL